MKKTIRLKTVIDYSPQEGVVARTYYDEKELDDLARTLAGSTGLIISHSYWTDEAKETKEYVTAEPAVTPEVPEENEIETQSQSPMRVEELSTKLSNDLETPKSAKKRR